MPYDNSNSGTLRSNTDKNKPGANPKWPDYKGKATINGEEYWISGWKREKDGSKFLSLSFQPKEQQRQPEARRDPPATQAASRSDEHIDEDVPF